MRSFEASSLMPGLGTRRLFLGLMASPGTRAALEDFRSMWHWPATARLTPAAQLHVTLHFLGDVTEVVEDELREALDACVMPPLTLALQDCEIWEGGIAVLRVADADAGLAALRTDLGRMLSRLGFPSDPRPYRPHVTLARHAEGALWPRLLAPVIWPASSLSLVWSRAGEYQTLETWQAAHLAPPPAARTK
jgi:2'-5' RNA ligase